MKITSTHIEVAKKMILDQAQAYRVHRHKAAEKVKALTKKSNHLSRGSVNLIKLTELNQITTELLKIRQALDVERRGVELNAECFNNEVAALGDKYKHLLLRIDSLFANRNCQPKKIPVPSMQSTGIQRFAGETVVHVSRAAALLKTPFGQRC